MLLRIQHILPKWNPITPGDIHDNLTLTKQCKERNQIAKANNGEIIFDPSVTCKDNLAKCFRIFTDPKRITNILAKRLQGHRANLHQ